MRSLEAPGAIRTGLIGVVLTILVLGVGQSITSVPMLFASPVYYGLFADSGGLRVADKVRLNGMDVGTVRTLKVDGDKVRVGFSFGGIPLRQRSRLIIRTDTILGTKVLEVEPHGTTTVRPNGTVPFELSTTPYQIYDAINDLTSNTMDWDVSTVKESLDVLAETAAAASPQLSAALDGVAKFSDTIGKRDDQLNDLLSSANKVASVLGRRREQVDRLLVDARALLAKFNARGEEIDHLLGNVVAVSEQVQAVVDENPNLNTVLTQFRGLSESLVKNKANIAAVLSTLDRFLAAINEAVASGPYFKAMVANLVPGQLIQPFVDAAFKKRGLDPEEFWRDAGLPAFRFPDPNGQRLPNGAPPPAPVPLEGTAEFPGPAVPPGSPCSYTPPADGVPRPQGPLPCARQTVGPFGDNPFGPNLGPLNVATSPPSPNGSAPAEGAPAAIPGQVPGNPAVVHSTPSDHDGQ